MLAVCTAQHEGTFQSAEAVRENTVCCNKRKYSLLQQEKIQSAATRAPLQDLVSPFPPTIQGGEQQVEPLLEKKVKQMTSDIKRASKKLCLSSCGESRVVYSSFGPAAVGVIKGMA